MANQIIWWIVRTFGSFYIRHMTTPHPKGRRRFAPLAVHRKGGGAVGGADPIALWLRRIVSRFKR